MPDKTADFAQGEDPDIAPAGGPEPEPGAPGGSDSTVGTSPEGDVSDPGGDPGADTEPFEVTK